MGDSSGSWHTSSVLWKYVHAYVRIYTGKYARGRKEYEKYEALWLHEHLFTFTCVECENGKGRNRKEFKNNRRTGDIFMSLSTELRYRLSFKRENGSLPKESNDTRRFVSKTLIASAIARGSNLKQDSHFIARKCGTTLFFFLLPVSFPIFFFCRLRKSTRLRK